MSEKLAGRKKETRSDKRASIRDALGTRSVVLIGLMGAGKTAVGKRLAARLELPFTDADSEIEVAAGESFTIINLDSARHTFTSSDGSWESVDLPADSQVPFTVPDSLAPGRYVFFCAIHSDMGGSLTIAG